MSGPDAAGGGVAAPRRGWHRRPAVYFSPVQNLRTGGRQSKSRYQYTLQSVKSAQLQEWSDKLMASMRADPIFRDVTSDSQQSGLEAHLTIDRDKANALGVQMQDVRTALYSAFGERRCRPSTRRSTTTT